MLRPEVARAASRIDYYYIGKETRGRGRWSGRNACQALAIDVVGIGLLTIDLLAIGLLAMGVVVRVTPSVGKDWVVL